MQKRSDRYTDALENEEVKSSRVNKHHALYEEINSKIGYEEIPAYSSDEQINLSSIDMGNLSRSEYQRVKDYKNLLREPEDNENPVQEETKTKRKNYDINKVLEEAKKNRELDELEGKRNLKNEDYNVLNNLNKKYLHQKGFTEEDNEELKELIDTITSKTLVDDIKDEEEKELLSELLATTIDIKLESELSNEELQELTGTKENTGLVDTNSFYSKSLELSGSDLLDSEEVEQKANEEEESNDNVLDVEEDRNIFKIVFISIILLIVVLIVSYFILQFLGISFN